MFMKDKILSIFVAFVRKAFTKERILDLVDDLLDIVYDRFVAESAKLPHRFLDQEDASNILKEACKKDEVSDSV